jgi:TPR repeat protein
LKDHSTINGKARHIAAAFRSLCLLPCLVYGQVSADLTKKALNGDSAAQLSLGETYRLGLGVDQNYVEALRFYKLAVLFENGQGVPRDAKEAALWYKKAAEQGHPDASFNLVVLYMNGVGVSRDPVQAHKWFIIAASHSDHGAEGPWNEQSLRLPGLRPFTR